MRKAHPLKINSREKFSDLEKRMERKVAEMARPKEEVISEDVQQEKVEKSYERVGSYTVVQEAVQNQQDASQIGLEIKKPQKEWFYSIKRRISRLEAVVEVLPYWRNGLTVFSLVYSIFTVVIFAILIFHNFSELPNKIPFFYDDTVKTWDLLDKSLIIFVPVVLGFLDFMIIRLSMLIFSFDRKLVYIISLAQIILNTFAIIGFIQLLSLVLF